MPFRKTFEYFYFKRGSKLKKIKASILIANYNNQKYILDCINSLLNQDFEGKFEIIFHDDNSRDNSLDIIKQFKNIKIIKNKKKQNLDLTIKWMLLGDHLIRVKVK